MSEDQRKQLKSNLTRAKNAKNKNKEAYAAASFLYYTYLKENNLPLVKEPKKRERAAPPADGAAEPKEKKTKKEPKKPKKAAEAVDGAVAAAPKKRGRPPKKISVEKAAAAAAEEEKESN